MDHFIQFLGLVLFISGSPGYEGILPVVDGKGSMLKHDALILAPIHTATFRGDGWKPAAPIRRTSTPREGTLR
jgi:hypothetical protein